jgi:hypothetical protein
MKQTAIQEMINEFTKELNVATQIGNEDKIRITKHLINIASKYLEMEEKQHKETFKQSRQAKIFEKGMPPVWDSWEKYYNETFKKE